MRRFNRSDRVSHLIQREVSRIIAHELVDERVYMVSVTGVEMSRDLKSARIFVSALEDRMAVDGVIEALGSSASFIRARLGERITLKYIPTLTFHYDSSIADGIRINTLLNEIHKSES